MTRVYVDAREVPLPPMTFESLDQVIKHVEEHVLLPHTVIRQIQIDGLPILTGDSGRKGKLNQSGAASRETIEFFTGTLGEIARDSIREAQSYLERVEAVTPSIVSSFQMSPGPEAFEQLRQLYDGFHWLNLLLDRLGTVLNVKSDVGIIEGMPARDCHLRFASILKQLIEAQERHDSALIADLLEYEVLPLIPEWRALFSTLNELAKKER